MKTINTAMGPIKLISLNKFINELMITATDGPDYRYLQYKPVEGFALSSSEEVDYNVNEFKARIVTPVKTNDLESLLLYSIYLQGSDYTDISAKQGLQYLIQDMVVDQAEKFVEPTHMVRLSKRTWMMVDFRDFRMVSFLKVPGVGFIIEKPEVIKIYEVYK